MYGNGSAIGIISTAVTIRNASLAGRAHCAASVTVITGDSRGDTSPGTGHLLKILIALAAPTMETLAVNLIVNSLLCNCKQWLGKRDGGAFRADRVHIE